MLASKSEMSKVDRRVGDGDGAAGAASATEMPPPSCSAMFAEKVLLVMVMSPLVATARMPPPSPPAGCSKSCDSLIGRRPR